MVWINRVLGGMFVYLGIRVAMLQTRRSTPVWGERVSRRENASNKRARTGF
jgi:hypothetical protein